jgi:hypothetical protein
MYVGVTSGIYRVDLLEEFWPVHVTGTGWEYVLYVYSSYVGCVGSMAEITRRFVRNICPVSM